MYLQSGSPLSVGRYRKHERLVKHHTAMIVVQSIPVQALASVRTVELKGWLYDVNFIFPVSRCFSLHISYNYFHYIFKNKNQGDY